ncbi:MAG: VWA domain-containing protein [Proteobacteria bacterium]|nr:VWA domain-containing protein [Pseudomonadota bacterium]
MTARPLATTIKALGRKTRRFLRRYQTRKGNVAMIFALSIPVVVAASLSAVDLHRASTVHMQLQDALDAATLAAARSTATTTAQIQSIGDGALKANLKNFTNASLTSDTFTLNADGTVVSSAAMDVKPMIANLFLGSDMNVGAKTQVVRQNYKLEVALVLDNTGSMAQDNKLVNAKTAANSLIDMLAAGAARSTDPNAVRISLVPFSSTVKIGSTYQNQTWIDQNGSSPINDLIFPTGGTTTPSAYQHANRFTLFTKMNIAWGGCVESRQYPYDVQDTAPSVGTPATLFTPYFAPDEPDTSAYSAWSSYDSTNNYISDNMTANTTNKNWWKRQGDIAKYKSSGLDLSSGKGPNQYCTMAPVMRMTTSFSSLKTAINGMVATGNTNVPMGLMWGWHTISPNAPFADGLAYGTDKLRKIVILMTDGDNTNDVYNNPNNSVYSGLGFIWETRLGASIGVSSTATQRTTAMNSRFTELCGNMKAKNIEIYVIGVEVASTTSSLLSTCATDASHYFDVTNSADLNATFQTIAGQIANLHLSQ